SVVVATVERELGAPLDRLFRDFEGECFAIGNVGQVHRAQLLDGRRVAVKVRDPAFAAMTAADLANLPLLKPLVAAFWPRARFAELLAHLQEGWLAEGDYLREAAVMACFARIFARHPRISVPRPVRELTTANVLVMDYIEGDGLAALRETGSAA